MKSILYHQCKYCKEHKYCVKYRLDDYISSITGYGESNYICDKCDNWDDRYNNNESR